MPFHHLGTAGITQADDPGNFIVSLAYGIVSGASEDLAFVVICHFHDISVTSGNYECHKWRLKIRVLDIVGAHMTVHVIDAYQGNVLGEGQSLSRCNSNYYGADESRAVSDSYKIHVVRSVTPASDRASSRTLFMFCR